MEDINDIDLVIAENIRRLRVGRGMAQISLADLAGITFQQLQQYESGTDRIPASTLYRIDRSLKADVSSFYEGMDIPVGEELPTVGVVDPGVYELGSIVSSIPSRNVMRALVGLATSRFGNRSGYQYGCTIMTTERRPLDVVDEITRLQNESLEAMIEVVVREALVHGWQPDEAAETLMAAIEEHIYFVIGSIPA